MKITISTPCHENWEAMTPKEKGRFCSVCSKTVRDFTAASDDEIIDVFSNPTDNICGNFYESQLNRNLQYAKINSVLVKFAVGFILTTGGFVSVQAQQNIANDTVKAGEIGEVVLFGFNKKTNQSMVAGAPTVISEHQLNKTQDNKASEVQPKTHGLKINPMPKDSSDKSEIRIGGAHANVKDAEKPLVVMDGKAVSFEKLNEIDPNSIETINIVKDASATVLYGEKGKNGVILLTTKKKWKSKKQKTSGN